MIDLRRLARGKPCMVRLPGICNGREETTVLAHYRLSGVSGIGYKPPDLCGAWACSDCHYMIDHSHDVDTKLAHLEGVIRTLAEIDRLGVLR
jgi:hypothetical protein